MAEKEKPKEILELEENLSVQLEEQPYETMTGEYYSSQQTFSLNKNGVIISLRLDDLEIKDFKILQQFSPLKQLSLNHSIVRNIEWLPCLTNIKELSFYESQITDYSPLIKLPHLKILWIAQEQFESTKFLEKLGTLEYLLIQHVKLENIQFVEKLPALKSLYLGDNQLSDIRPLKHLHQLSELAAWNNSISVITSLRELKSLKKIYMGVNLISDIEPLADIPTIVSCSLHQNHIQEIPAKLFVSNPKLQITNDRNGDLTNRFVIADNPLTSPPYSVIELGMSAVNAYFENKEKYGADPLNEGRIILVGDGSAGKSSLMDRILYNSFDKDKSQTDGIKIEQWHLLKEGRELRFNMWDFGGQEVQHAVHKFFFTSGCLYILVLDNRKEEEPEYWLQQIETLGSGAPVLVVFNKSDQNFTENVDRKFLKEKYPNIVGFFNVSCKTGTGLRDFQNVMEGQAPKLTTIDDQFPGNWFNIKREIEAATGKSNHYLVYDAYVEICKKHGVADEETQKLLLKYFSFIGAVTWFGESSAYLQHMHVLNPAWITQGVYHIVTGKKTELLKGQIKITDFKELLQPTNPGDFEYNENHYGYILALMEKFELCYTENDINLLIPSRFSKEPKIEYSEFKGKRVRVYMLQFKDYLPVAVIHQFIVRNIQRAFNKNYWYQGIVIQDDEAQAMVQLDKEAKRIYIRIKGDYAIGLWESIRAHFKDICARYARLIYSEQVAVNVDDVENVVEYQDLINHLKVNKTKYFHPKLIKEYDVSYLIGLFEPKEMTLQKFETIERSLNARNLIINVQNILNNTNQNNNRINVDVEINIDIQLVNNLSNKIKDEANYLLSEIKNENKELKEALQKALSFAEEANKIKNKEEIQGKGWGRKIKQITEAIKTGEAFLKVVPEGIDAAHKVMHSLNELAQYLHIIAAAAS